LDSSQLYDLRAGLRESGFFQAEDTRETKNVVCGYSSEFTCRTSNYPFVRREEDVHGGKLQELIRDILLIAEAWERNGMKYYGREGELEERMEEIILALKLGMPEKPRLAVAGPIRFIERVRTLNDTAYLFSIRVDTVY
jgi:hypothetical protein